MVQKAFIFIVITFIFLTSNTKAETILLEEDDTPISFKIELLPWEVVNDLLPNKSYFTIVDVETGMQFRVQRRAGSRHADVQPLTIKDTKIMKKIYNGKWSWKRRAIFVKYEDQLIAASMHGMPHGAGALKNGFPGHFCVHFFGSTTHRSNHPDFAHFLMQLKARGKLAEFVNTADPYQLIEIFTTAVNQADNGIEALTFYSDQPANLRAELNEITSFKVKNASYLPTEDLNQLIAIEIPVEIEIYRENSGKEVKTITFNIIRGNVVDRWFLDGNHLLDELNE